MNGTALCITSALVSLTLFSSVAVAEEKPLSRKEVEDIVKQVILDNPEVLMKSVENYQVKMQAERASNAAKAIKDLSSGLDTSSSPVAGNPKGDITVFEFFDYHCGYCKHMLPVVTQLLEQDKNVKFVFKELPILSEDSTLAAKAALGVYKVAPKKYFEYHSALMKASGQFDEAKLLELASSIGVDAAKVKTAMASKEVSDEISKNRELSQKAGISGTPAMIVGGQLIPGAVDLPELKKKIAEERAAKKK
jgi:protein-disulfide isomerase